MNSHSSASVVNMLNQQTKQSDSSSSSAEQSPSIITIQGTSRLDALLKPCQAATPDECASTRSLHTTFQQQQKIVAFRTIIEKLQICMNQKIPGTCVFPATHAKPAYLAANQIGYDKRIVLLYLPGDQSKNKSHERLILVNPTYEELEPASADAKKYFYLNTFSADQIRFRSDGYASKVKVTYQDAYCSDKHTLELTGLEAIAAQMGINFVYGITPLDHHIDPAELRQFAKQRGYGSIRETDKLATTTNVYHALGRDNEIDPRDSQFDPELLQLDVIPAYLDCRKANPCIYDPHTGEEIKAARNPHRRSAVVVYSP